MFGLTIHPLDCRVMRTEALCVPGMFFRPWVSILLPQAQQSMRLDALITGRNHHSVGFGVISEQSTGYPGLRLHHRAGERHHRRDPEAERLRHVVVRQEPQHAELSVQRGRARSTNGRVGMGFEYFYGFMGGETDQWTPYLFRNTTQIFPWIGKPGYNLITDMADEAIDHMQAAERGRARQAVLRLLRARRHARAAPADAGVDRRSSRASSTWAGTRCASRSSPTRSGSA